MRTLTLACCIILITACSTPVKRATLRDVDVVGTRQGQNGAFIKPKSEEEIKQAYADYLKYASKNDLSRQDALHRLAQMEFDLSEKMAKDKSKELANEVEDKILAATLNRTIDLLQTSLRDYPNSKDNDKAYYQLAKAYEQRNEYAKSMDALQQLAAKHPASPYFLEAQFRIAEDNFSRRNYSKAEDLYTQVIVSRKNNQFYEKALYKRGWARFKQEYYNDAVEDFAKVISLNPFEDYSKLTSTQKEQADEYFRAFGLAFAYLGGAAPLNAYLKANPDFKNTYQAYASVSDVYLKQEQYSDAVKTLEQFIKHSPKSPFTPEAQLKVISVWKQAGFASRAISSTEAAYEAYHPRSTYWTEKGASPDVYKQVRTILKEHIITAASHMHNEYNKTGKEEFFVQANKWYDRYLEHYESQSRKDNIHFLYADLLKRHKDLADALKHYELAAYDSDIILNKDAAYESVIASAQLYKNERTSSSGGTYLGKLIKYSLLYTQLYPNDSRTANILSHASESAFSMGMFADAIKFAGMAPAEGSTADTYNLSLIKAHSYYKLQQYKDAEAGYRAILDGKQLDSKTKAQMLDNLALAIYKQGEEAVAAKQTEQALNHYSRISASAPGSSIAATGLYDAITLAINSKMWNDSIAYIRRFQSLYPQHPQSHEVTKKLSVALLESQQGSDAASVLEKLSKSDKDQEYQMAALWKAAELYESGKNYPAAVAKYEEYANRFPAPYPQYLEAMNKLVQIHIQQGDTGKATTWRRKIIDADGRANVNNKTDRTRFITSLAALSLAKQDHASYLAIKLTLPLEQTLKRKKQAMQSAVVLYGKVSSYGVAETATEATYAIGEIYREFSKALLESERPRNLSKTENEQYKILLEDQAFPFEEKAIEFYEANLGHIKTGHYDDWVAKSVSRLKILFPTRYNREALLDAYINVLH